MLLRGGYAGRCVRLLPGNFADPAVWAGQRRHTEDSATVSGRNQPVPYDPSPLLRDAAKTLREIARDLEGGKAEYDSPRSAARPASCATSTNSPSTCLRSCCRLQPRSTGWPVTGTTP